MDAVHASERSHPELAGQVVIVTGGTRGIGLGIVRVLARAGVKLVVTGRKPERLERVAAELAQLGAAHRTLAADHADPASSRAVVYARFGVPDEE
jgi:NAD(P)-dependent dehydrogenase (short-subunit alcohol dehydrogenase family)